MTIEPTRPALQTRFDACFAKALTTRPRVVNDATDGGSNVAATPALFEEALELLDFDFSLDVQFSLVEDTQLALQPGMYLHFGGTGTFLGFSWEVHGVRSRASRTLPRYTAEPRWRANRRWPRCV